MVTNIQSPDPNIDREVVCWTTTAGGGTVFTGTIRHDDALTGPTTPGWALFNQHQAPVPGNTPGLTFVPCAGVDAPVNYQTTVVDVTGGATQTFAPAGDMVSIVVRNRDATTATMQVNGGAVLPLDTAETWSSSLTGHDSDDVLLDTVVVDSGDGAVRVSVQRRLP